MLDRLEKRVLLSKHTTFGIGGEAPFFLSCETVEDLKRGVEWAKKESVPYLVLGHGSNCLFSDGGYPGLILQNKIQTFEEGKEGSFVIGSGYSFPLLGVRTVNEGWAGLEFAAGVPGSVGGAVFMNAGANDQEVFSVLTFVDVLEEGEIRRIPKEQLSFGYRFSSFQETKMIIVAAGFQLTKDERAKERQQKILHHRKKTQPLKERSAGCVFRNPPEMHAGKLIEEVGLKGTRIGGAQISSVHANFIINAWGATAADVKSLIQRVQSTVFEKKNISLHCEVRII